MHAVNAWWMGARANNGNLMRCDCSQWIAFGKNDRLIRSVLAMSLALMVGTLGCNQGGSTGPFDPYAQTPPGSTPPSGLFARNAYFAELRRKANEQARLAAEQQQQLAQLQDLQRTNEQELAQLRDAQSRQRTGQLEEQRQQEQLLVQRAREALGRYEELEQRARALDVNNRDVQARIAQIQQQNQLLDDQNNLLRQRLDETSRQLASAMDASKQSEERLQTMMASTRRRSGASITANNSYRRNLTAVTVPGLSIRQDGELVRIELPSDQLFEPTTARLRPEANALLDEVANVVLNNYSRQVIGVEAHADNSSLEGTLWRNAHQLTAAQAMAVFEQMSYRHRLLPQQLFVLGHGQNYPLASNATPVGQQRNRRVEIVVYPEVVGQR
jgi:chemotaxis protein MotB